MPLFHKNMKKTWKFIRKETQHYAELLFFPTEIRICINIIVKTLQSYVGWILDLKIMYQTNSSP